MQQKRHARRQILVFSTSRFAGGRVLFSFFFPCWTRTRNMVQPKTKSRPKVSTIGQHQQANSVGRTCEHTGAHGTFVCPFFSLSLSWTGKPWIGASELPTGSRLVLKVLSESELVRNHCLLWAPFAPSMYCVRDQVSTVHAFFCAEFLFLVTCNSLSPSQFLHRVPLQISLSMPITPDPFPHHQVAGSLAFARLRKL